MPSAPSQATESRAAAPGNGHLTISEAKRFFSPIGGVRAHAEPAAARVAGDAASWSGAAAVFPPSPVRARGKASAGGQALELGAGQIAGRRQVVGALPVGNRPTGTGPEGPVHAAGCRSLAGSARPAPRCAEQRSTPRHARFGPRCRPRSLQPRPPNRRRGHRRSTGRAGSRSPGHGSGCPSGHSSGHAATGKAGAGKERFGDGSDRCGAKRAEA